jgi:hypothetical protein
MNSNPASVGSGGCSPRYEAATHAGSASRSRSVEARAVAIRIDLLSVDSGRPQRKVAPMVHIGTNALSSSGQQRPPARAAGDPLCAASAQRFRSASRVAQADDGRRARRGAAIRRTWRSQRHHRGRRDVRREDVAVGPLHCNGGATDFCNGIRNGFLLASWFVARAHRHPTGGVSPS